jgi:hypothetical protein
MKNAIATAAPTPGISNGNSKLRMPTFSRAGLTPGLKLKLSFYENFLRPKNGPVRCQLQRPFKKCSKSQINSYHRRPMRTN